MYDIKSEKPKHKKGLCLNESLSNVGATRGSLSHNNVFVRIHFCVFKYSGYLFETCLKRVDPATIALTWG